MRFFSIIGFTILLAGNTQAQSAVGITGTRDTSYNITAEYTKHLKNHPGIRIVDPFNYSFISEERNTSYCSTKERELKLDVFYPTEKTATKRTAIVFIHGGGWRSGNKDMHHPLMQQLAALGYVCITPEYRLSTEALYPAAVHDIKSAIRWTRQHANRFDIDVNRIVVAGHSAGGELAAFMGATNKMKHFEGMGCSRKFSSIANAVIDLDGTLAFIHPESGEGDDSKRTSSATYWFGYGKTENPEVWRQAAPLTHVGKHTPPTLFINSGVARMHAGRDDFMAVLEKYKIDAAVKTFEGSPHSFILFHPWFDSTVVYMDRFLQKQFPATKKKTGKTLTVAKDGSGDFTTVQTAINAVPKKNNSPVTIIIKKGTYKEKILVDSLQRFITLVGEDKVTTILTYDDHTGKIGPAGDTINTRTSWSFKIKADHFTAKKITFRNDAGFSAGQAVAVESDGDKAIFQDCQFIGNQDVLFTNSEKSRQYYKDCYIEGTTDFIFGSSTAWFEQCTIYSKKNSHVTAASTPKENEFGYIFYKCELKGDTSLHNVSLGRPWRPYSQVTYIACYMGPHIKPEGWSKWNNNDNHLTSRYTEYNNFGPSSALSNRPGWTKALTPEEAKKISLLNVLRGWDPLR